MNTETVAPAIDTAQVAQHAPDGFLIVAFYREVQDRNAGYRKNAAFFR